MQIDVLHYITLRYITLHYNAPVGKKSPTVDRPRFWLQRISSSRADSKSPAINNQHTNDLTVDAPYQLKTTLYPASYVGSQRATARVCC